MTDSPQTKMSAEAAIVILLREMEIIASLAKNPLMINEIKHRATYTLDEVKMRPVIKNRKGRVLSACEVALACDTNSYRSVEEKVADDNDLVVEYRGRHYVMCRSTNDFIRAVEAMSVSAEIKRELTNQMVAVLRMTLVLNGATVSDVKLNAF